MTTKTKPKAPDQTTGGPVAPREPAQPLSVASVPGSMLRASTVVAVTGLSRATLYRMILKGDFPKAVQLSRHCVAWRQADVAAWTASRSAS